MVGNQTRSDTLFRRALASRAGVLCDDFVALEPWQEPCSGVRFGMRFGEIWRKQIKNQNLWTCQHSIFSVVGDTFADPILRNPPPPHASSAPFAPPPALLGSPPCHILALRSSLITHRSRSGGRDFTLRPEKVGSFPSKTPSDSDLVVFENVRICTYTYVYACISRYMLLNGCICTYMHVYCTYNWLPKSIYVYACML